MSPVNVLVEMTWKHIKKDVAFRRFNPSSVHTASLLMEIFMGDESMQNELEEIFENLSEYLHAWKVLPMQNSRSLLDSIKVLVKSLDDDLFGTRPEDMSAESIIETAQSLATYAKSLARTAARI